MGKNIHLSAAVAAEFEVTGKVPGDAFTDAKFGRVDFTSMTLKQAEQLERRNFPYLKRKPKAEPKEKENKK